MQARLELDDPHLTPFGPSKNFQSPDSLKALPTHLIDTALQVLRTRPTAEVFPAGKGKVLCRDDAAGDPASLGIPCLLYGLAERGDVEAGTKTEGQMAKANDVGMLEAVELEANLLEEDACRVCAAIPAQEVNNILTPLLRRARMALFPIDLVIFRCGLTLCTWFRPFS